MQLKSLLAAALLTAPALLAAPASAADWDGGSSNWSSNRYQAERSDRGADDDVGEADDVNGRNDGDDNDVAEAEDINGRDDGGEVDGDRYGSAEGDRYAAYPRRWQRAEHPDYRRLRWWGENRQWHRRWRREAYGIDDGRSNRRRRDW